LANDIADGGRSQEHRGHRDVRLEEAALVRRESLRQDFRLTAAQAGFTREILKADEPQAAADRLGISLQHLQATGMAPERLVRNWHVSSVTL
jgi:hypothetical protein